MRHVAVVTLALLMILPLAACSDQATTAPDSIQHIEGSLTAFSSAVERDGPVEITVVDRFGTARDLSMSPWTMTREQWDILATLRTLPLGTWVRAGGAPRDGGGGLELVALEVLAAAENGRMGTGCIGVPDPVIEPNHQIVDTPAIYCVAWNDFDANGTPAPATRLLTSLIDAGFAPVNAWFPTQQTPCASIGAMAVAYVELAVHDDRLIARGFLAAPADWWSINCGVPTLWHYVFP